MSDYKVIGLMSGSSLDGLDIAYCHFRNGDGKWHFSIEQADCIPYSKEWQSKLAGAPGLDGKGLWKLHTDYGHLLAKLLKEFISSHNLKGNVDLIASHGHTAFHFPEAGFTTQIGDGAALATGTGVTVACDLRSADIALGGQGSPIVPIGDLQLFSEYKYLLNLGGIANLSIRKDNRITAFDVGAANQVLNHYASIRGQEYDEDGHLASEGHLHDELLDALNRQPYYQKNPPKSLDNGFSKEVIIPLIDSFEISAEDKLHTYCEHIALQVSKSIKISLSETVNPGKLFITGGGAFNKFLVRRLEAHSAIPVQIPSDEIIKYKEALVMAFIGLLRWRGEPNVLSSVTGASRDSVGGALYHP